MDGRATEPSNRRIATLVASVALLAASVGSVPAALGEAGSTGAHTVDRPRTDLFPDTTDGIHLELVFNSLVPRPSDEAGVVDVVWGSAWAHRPAGVYNSYYVPFDLDQDPSQTLAWWKTHHPDLIAYRCDRVTPAWYPGNHVDVPLDFADPAVREYQWSRWISPALHHGFPGIAFDLVGLNNSSHRCGHLDAAGGWVQQYDGRQYDPAFMRDVIGWARATRARIHASSQTATMQINNSFDANAPFEQNVALMTSTDLNFAEAGFTVYGYTPAQWLDAVRAIQTTQDAGVCYTDNDEFFKATKDITYADRMWSLANYLLIKDRCTYTWESGYNANGAQDYGRLILFPEYSLSIGHPLGPIETSGAVSMRRYSGGLALVNPTYDPATVTLPPGSYTDEYGDPVGPTVRMKRQAGLVLLLAG